MINYAELLPYYPDPNDPQFQQKLYNKEEFYKLKLDRQQEAIQPGEYLRHQLIIARYLSAHTQYDGLLLAHAMGTGKTCAAFAMTESLKLSANFKRCIVIARGKDSLVNLKRNFVFSCSTSYNIERTQDARRQIMQINRALKNFYDFRTFLTFARELANLSDDYITKTYANMIFVIDEVHNIKGQDIDASVYQQIHRLFHLTNGCKKLLMTGTPMSDDASELADLLNLLLPLNQQMPTGAEFTRAFLLPQKDGTFVINPASEARLKTYITGRMSCLTNPPNIRLDYKNGLIDKNLEFQPVEEPFDIPQFRTVRAPMRSVQKSAYERAFALDTSSAEARSIYNNAMQASLFVFPDGSWGEDGLKKYNVGARSLILSKELVSRASRLDDLAELSIKYASTIATILQNPKKNIYIYCSVVNGSGAKLFCKLLELYGYARCTGNEVSKGRRYILLTGDTSNIGNLINYYNNDRNVYGEYCQVIVGSRKISEEYTFKNVIITILLTLFWNYTQPDQAIARGARLRSHMALERATGKPAVVDIIQMASTMGEDARSIDLMMLAVARRKDITIKRVFRICQESSFDCALTYERNVGEVNYSRECNYQLCEYKCDTSARDRTTVDIATYELYYSNFMDLIPRVSQLFRTRDHLSYTTLYDIVMPSNAIQLLKCLAFMIENNVVLFNRHKLPCFLREQADIYFLVGSASVPFQGNLLLEKYHAYVERPLLARAVSLDHSMHSLEVEVGMRVLQRLVNNPPATVGEFDLVFRQLPARVATRFVQMAVERVLRKMPSRFAQFILVLFEDKLYFPARGEYSAVFDTELETTCAKATHAGYEWVACKATIPVAKERRVRVDTEEKVQEYDIPEGTKYVGIVQEDKFCIQDLSKVNIKDKRRRTSGAVCIEAGWKKDRLLDVAKELGIRSTGWPKKTKADICNLIYEHLDTKGLIRRGKCGTSRKVK